MAELEDAMKTMTATMTGLAAAALLGATAQAADKAEVTKAQTSETVQTVKTIDADGVESMKTVTIAPTDMRRTAVMSALEAQTTDSYIIEGNDGELYINHLIPVEELPDPTLSVQAEDTYTLNYQGMTFTNKIISE